MHKRPFVHSFSPHPQPFSFFRKGRNEFLLSKYRPSAQCLKITQNVAFEFWYFPPIFVLLKLTCLVTLFDRKLQVFKNSPN